MLKFEGGGGSCKQTLVFTENDEQTILNQAIVRNEVKKSIRIG